MSTPKQDFAQETMRIVTTMLHLNDQARGLLREALALGYDGDGLTDADLEGMPQPPAKAELVAGFGALNAIDAAIQQHAAALYALKRRM